MRDPNPTIERIRTIAGLLKSTSFTRTITTWALVGTVIWAFQHILRHGLPQNLGESALLTTLLGWIISEASAALKYLNGTTAGSGAKTAAMVDLASRPPLALPPPDAAPTVAPFPVAPQRAPEPAPYAPPDEDLEQPVPPPAKPASAP